MQNALSVCFPNTQESKHPKESEGLGRVNLVCVATERSLLTTSTLLQQVKNKHLLLSLNIQKA
jgi:hypothetical protein